MLQNKNYILCSNYYIKKKGCLWVTEVSQEEAADQTQRADLFFPYGPVLKKQQFLIVESANKLIVESTNKNGNFDELKGL